MAKVYIAIGSNIGDKQKNIDNALARMRNNKLDILKISSMYETLPYGDVVQEKFLNAVCLVETNVLPNELLKILKDIEKNMGRIETVRWGPRIIDLDIILYDDIFFEDELLNIPHKDMLNRIFVLEPLVELTGDNYLHPVTKKTLKSHLDLLLGGL